MFLDTVLARNPELAEAAAVLHDKGAVPPDTYVVDRDAVEANAELLAGEAQRLGLGLWFVVKHLGRNPELIRAVARHLPEAAAIDAPEARALNAAGARPANVGHLVQIPRRALPEVLAWRPSYVTVFDTDNARAVSAEAVRQSTVQDVLVRVEGDPRSVYPGQEGGVPLERLDSFAEAAEALPGIRIAGVTGFPCLLCDPRTGTPQPTTTFALLRKARAQLAGRGHTGLRLSAPSATCVASLPLLSDLGATHGEPGHALTGTTPLHALDQKQPERPAYVYVTEVSHTLADGRPALHGGGFYPRADIGDALLYRTGTRLRVGGIPAENIDYYRLLSASGHGHADGAPRSARTDVRAGDTAVLAFRTQIFVTRSNVAVVSGLSSGAPELTGLYGPLGGAL